MKVLIACEYSGIVREAFKRKGHWAISCDILPSDNKLGPHLKQDVITVLKGGPILGLTVNGVPTTG